MVLFFSKTLTTVRTVRNADEITNILPKFAESDYDLMVIDSISMLQVMTLHEVTNGNKATIKDFGEVNNKMMNMMLNFPYEEKHLICTSPIREAQVDKDIILKPSVSGQFGELIGRWFNIIGFIEFRSRKRKIHFVSGSYYQAKTEIPELPEQIENATFADIYKHYIGGEKR